MEQAEILLIEDDEDHYLLFTKLAERASSPLLKTTRVATLTAGQEQLKKRCWDVVFLDLGLPESQGLRTLERILEVCEPGVVVVVLTATESIEVGSEALRLGAHDFMSKSELSTYSLQRSIRYSSERAKARRELEKVNESLAAFAGAAAHDLAAPLRHIERFSQIVRGDVGGLVPERTLTHLSYIENSAQRLKAMIRGLLEFSRSGTLTAASGQHLISEIVEEALTLLSDDFGKEKPSIKVESGQIAVTADRLLMVRVMQNLLANALTYVDKARPPDIKVSATKDDLGVTISVADNGLGIPSECLEQIFQPLRRLHSEVEFPGGTGIGLATCHRIATAHGGKIWATSELGKGSVFHVFLPQASDQGETNLATENQNSQP